MAARTPARSKYGARRTEYAGCSYDSAAEARYAFALDVRQHDGAVIGWRRPAPIVLLDAPTAADRVTYRPDFEVWLADGTREYVEVKGAETRDWRLKLKLFKANGPPIPLRVVYGDGREVVITSRKAA